MPRNAANTAKLDEKALLQNAQRGDKEALEILVKETARKLARIATLYFGQHADDAVQRVFVRILPNLNRIRVTFTSFAIATLRNLWRDDHRRNTLIKFEPLGNEDAAEHYVESPLERLLRGEGYIALRAAMDSLTETEHTAVVLHHMDGVPIAEVAIIIKKREGATKMMLARARQKLAKKLGGSGKTDV